jgi:hypothetical protein
VRENGGETMAAGPSLIGAGAFVAVKLAGYTAAGAFAKRRYGTARVSPFVFGVVRTLVGIAAGVACAIAADHLGLLRTEWLWFVLLVPVRLAEWSLVLALFFERGTGRTWRLLRWSALGSAWSYVLDAPAIAAMLLIPGGFWVC